MSTNRNEQLLNTSALKQVEVENAGRTLRSFKSNTSLEVRRGDVGEDSKCRTVKSVKDIKSESTEQFVTEESVPVPVLPTIPMGMNVPEQIIIVFDRVKDEVENSFFECGDRKVNPRNVMARVLKMFIHNKLTISNRHSFAIMALNDLEASWCQNKLTSNTNQLEKNLDKLTEPPCNAEDIFQLTSVFNMIIDKFDPVAELEQDQAPTKVYRVIFCYGRSFTLPTLKATPRIQSLLDSPNFFFDVFYTHELPEEVPSKFDNICELLDAIVQRCKGHFYKVSRNVNEAHVSMAKLLAHPLQRSPQCLVELKVEA